MWVVQAALIRPFLEFLNQQAGLTLGQQILLDSISPIDCGALAHSEPREAPVTVTPEGDGYRLNGVKKYITGGDQADFIFITCRAPGEERITQLILLPAKDIVPPEMETLDLKGLYTISHGRLTLNNKMISARYCLQLSPEPLRKELKVNGLVERSLIIEAVLSNMTYLNHRLGRLMPQPPVEVQDLNGLMKQQSEYTTTTIVQAQSEQHVQLMIVDFNAVNTFIERICEAADNIDLLQDLDLVDRINDLRFIRSLWGGS